MPSEFDVFISYATEDYGTALRLYNDLKKSGVTPWLDRENLRPGENWQKGKYPSTDFFRISQGQSPVTALFSG